jgi:hypothetical protein
LQPIKWTLQLFILKQNNNVWHYLFSNRECLKVS